MSVPAKVYRRSELEAIRPAMDADGCLYRYKAIWLEGHDDTSDPAQVGIAFHAVQHAYIEKLLAAQVGQDAELADEAFVEGVAAAQTPSRLIPQVRDVWMWHAESFELDLDRFVTAEERGSAGDVGFAPDLVYAHPESNALEVVDFKSGWHPPGTEAEVKALFQARVYARYAMDRWPHFSRYQFTLIAVRFRQRVTVTFTPSELDAVEQEVRAAIATIEAAIASDTFPATAGPACHFCQLDCPLLKQEVMLPPRLSPAQVPVAAAWVLVAEKQLKAVKKALKGAVGVLGPVTVNGVEFANRPTVSRAYPIDVLIEALRAAGVMGAFEDAAARQLTVSHSALAKLFKQYPKLEEALQPHVQTKTSYRFSGKAPGQDEDDE